MTDVLMFAVFLVGTPVVILGTILKFTHFCVYKPLQVFTDQRYALYLLMFSELIDIVIGMSLEVSVFASKVENERILGLYSTYSGFAFNWHIMISVFYLYFFNRRLKDSLESTTVQEAIVFFLITAVAAATTALDPKFESLRPSAVLGMALAITIPLMFGWYVQVREASDGMLAPAMARQIPYLSSLVLVEVIAVFLNSIVASLDLALSINR